MEVETCEIMCQDSLYIYDNTDCFSLNIDEISFPLAPHIVNSKQNLEHQSESSVIIRTNLNKAISHWKYKLVKGIDLVHYCDKIYVPQNLWKRVLKCYHCYLQHPGGDRLAHTLTTVCRWLGIVDQSWKLCITCKDCQK